MQGSSESQPQGNGRRKVKTGCKTCKARRVKCDESRPACRRCVSTGRVCNGYGIWGGGDNKSPVQCSQALSIHRTPVPETQRGLTSDELMSFDWFREKTTKKLAGLFTSDFWETLVFQASVQEPAVRHAVVALSAAHRSDFSHGPSAIAARGPNAEQFMLQNYNKAISYLRSASTSENAPDIRVILITCMIFVTLEYLRGHYTSGSSHLQYGIQLLSELSPHRSDSKTLPQMSRNHTTQATDFAHNALIDSYAQLTIQSAMFGIFPSHMCVTTHDQRICAQPYNFKSIIEARQPLDDLLHKVKCLKEDFHAAIETGSTIDHTAALATQAFIQQDLFAWRQAYDRLVASLQPIINLRDLAGSIIIRVYYEMASVMAGVSLSETEMAFDAYTDNFTAIIAGFHELSRAWSLSNVQTPDPKPDMESGNFHDRGFTIESGYIPPAYYTAMKCRIPQLRRQAIHALRLMPRREGIWNGILLADVLDEVVGIEEGRPRPGDPNPASRDPASGGTENQVFMTSVNESSRISDVKVLLSDTTDETQRDTYIGYKKMMLHGNWATCKQKIERRAAVT